MRTLYRSSKRLKRKAASGPIRDFPTDANHAPYGFVWYRVQESCFIFSPSERNGPTAAAPASPPHARTYIG